jgi:RimJ/RimL family protein N-acetyltransferase
MSSGSLEPFDPSTPVPSLIVHLSVPPEGLRGPGLVLRLPSLDDVDGILPAFTDPELREAGNLPAFGREELIASLQELPLLAKRGRLLALAAVDAETGEVVGGGTLHHLDAERKIVEIGYFVLPHARRHGVATKIARMLAEHAFSLGIERVAAYVNVGNTASERVAERAGFTREGVVRSMPKPDGRRVDKTLFSLLPGE